MSKVLLTLTVKTDQEDVADTIRAVLRLCAPVDPLLRSNAAVTCVPLDDVDQRQCSALRALHGLPQLDGLRLAPAIPEGA